MNAQIIEKNGKPEWAVIPYGEFIKIQKILEDAEDIKDIEENLKAIEENREIVVPGEVTFAIIDGTHPIRAWREYKNMRINELAKRIGISGSYLSQIENGKRNPTIETLKAIARALDIEPEMLI
jgi:DNA-binding XRE family transcriptional regulator